MAFTSLVASTKSAEVIADVWHTHAHDLSDYAETYYFCCRTCGACGRRWVGVDPAVNQAVDHIINAHPLEDHHE